MQRKLLMKGKVKEAYDLGDRLEFRFTDNISVFDKVIPSQIPFKGETLSREGMYWFKIAEKMGIKTHFLEYLPPAGMSCRKVDILQPGQITSKSKNYLIPLEWICRWYVAGSLYDRVKEGRISARELGFPAGHAVSQGEPLPEPFIEVSTKLEKTDRLLQKDEALQISGLSADEYEQAREIVLRIDEDLGRSVLARGLIHVDGKKELAFDEERSIMSSTSTVQPTRTASGTGQAMKRAGSWTSPRSMCASTTARPVIRTGSMPPGRPEKRSRQFQPCPMMWLQRPAASTSSSMR